MIKFENVSKNYGKTKIICELNLEIEEGRFIVLIGPSGCGKTTTLRMINRLIEPSAGKVLINGKDIARVNPVGLRRTIGYVIQQIGLFPNMTVEQNICVVPKLLKYSKNKCDEIVRDLLALVNMDYGEYAHKYPSELSGGEQQRIGVLRAIAASPPIVLMDEPFGALDPVTREILQDEIKKIQRKLNKTIIFVTHDMDEALRLADSIVFMDEGRIVQAASPEEMLQNPANGVIRSFMGKRHSHIDFNNLSAADIMRPNVLKVSKTKHTLECVEIMSRREVNTLVVVDDEERYSGIVSIDDVKKHGRAGRPISEFINYDTAVVGIDSAAKEAFEKLVDSKTGYAIVLNDNQTVAGLITKTSMVKAMAQAMWGEED